jgi:hypothetical protein
MPTARIVFDRQEGVSYYAPAIQQLQPVSYLMGEILDSSDVSAVTTSAYTQRTQQFLAAIGTQIDLWEVGNEINGAWLGTSADVVAKMTGAYELVHAAGKRPALTRYYNGVDDTNNCDSNRGNLMFRWAQTYVPDRMKQGLDDVFIPFYDQDCPGVSHDWTSIFTQRHQMFPNSTIGFGENGTHRASDPTALKQQYYGYRLPCRGIGAELCAWPLPVVLPRRLRPQHQATVAQSQRRHRQDARHVTEWSL